MRRRIAVFGCLVSLSLATAVAFSQDRPDEGETLAETTIGIEGTVTFKHVGPALSVRRTDETSPILIRVADRRPELDGGTTYELRFIAIKPGVYDLRDLLELEGRRPAEGVPPLRVRVTSLLPADHAGDLDEIAAPADPRLGGYRTVLILLGVGWISPVVYVMVKRLVRRTETVAQVVVAEPTLADQLRPLVEAALAGTVTLEQQARLELLLLTHWRGRLGLREIDQAEAIRRMRRDADAGALLVTIERWLHSPDRGLVGPEEVSAVLEPYRHAAAIEELSNTNVENDGGGTPVSSGGGDGRESAP